MLPVGVIGNAAMHSEEGHQKARRAAVWSLACQTFNANTAPTVVHKSKTAITISSHMNSGSLLPVNPRRDFDPTQKVIRHEVPRSRQGFA